MHALLRTFGLAAALFISAAAFASEAVPVNATFGIQWTPENWNPYGEDNPIVRETSSVGAAGLPNGKVIAIQSYDFLDTQAGTINGEAALFFNYEDGVVVEYTGTASFDPQTFTASFSGPMTVIGGWGRFAGSSGALPLAGFAVNDASGAEFAGGTAEPPLPPLPSLPPPPHEVIARAATAMSAAKTGVCMHVISPSSQPSSAASLSTTDATGDPSGVSFSSRS